MGERDDGSGRTLGRDPFEGMDWSAGPTDDEVRVPPAEAAPYAVLRGAGSGTPLGGLVGKGVWMLYSREVDLAIEMAVAIGAGHILYKTGHRGMFFVEAAQRVRDRVRAAGLIPFAWPFIHCDDPLAEAEVAIKSWETGYDGIVFDIEDQAGGQAVGAAALGRRVLEAGLDPQRLYYTSFPNIWQHLDIPYREMNQFCRGGFMPQCYPTFQRTPRTVVQKWAYGEHARWTQEWGNMPPLYPILAAYKDEHANERLSGQEFLEWAQALAAHDPPFYSIYRAETTPRELWPILAALGVSPSPVLVTPPEVAEPEPVAIPAPSPIETQPTPVAPAEVPATQPVVEEDTCESPPVYHIVTVNDSVWSLCARCGLSRAQFWEWNGHLWDERGLPRDALYMQEGWRLRIG